MSLVSVFLAMSIDGYIAGEGGDLSWLPQGEAGDDFGYGYFYASVGAILMGRKSYDAVLGLTPTWPYGEMPVLVATHRELQAAADTIIPVSGDISELIELAQAMAGSKKVYLDGGTLIRAALAADRVDELILTVVPLVLGAGTALFEGLRVPSRWRLVSAQTLCQSLVQIHYRKIEAVIESGGGSS